MPSGGTYGFGTNEANELFELLTAQRVASEDEAGATVHALVDIAESMDRIYRELIPKIMNGSDEEPRKLQDILWEIRDEFRHVDYHIHDARLTDL